MVRHEVTSRRSVSGEDGGGGRPMRPGFIGMVRILHSDSRAWKGFNQIRDMIKSSFNV